MSTTLVLLGILVVIAAAGAAVKAFGVEIDAVATRSRQVLVAVLGIVIIIAGVLVGVAGKPDPTRSRTAEPPWHVPGSAATTPATEAPPPEPTRTTASTERYVPLVTEAPLTMPAAKGCADASVAVTFTADGPMVETGIATGNVGNPAAGDIFYANCTDSDTDQIFVPDENPFTRQDGDADAALCARKANAEPVGKSIPRPTLRPGMGFCLISLYNSVIVHLRLTGVAANGDLTWTATTWLDTDAPE